MVMKLPKKPLEQARDQVQQHPKIVSEFAEHPQYDFDFVHHPHYDNQPRPEDGTPARQTWRFGVRPSNFDNKKFPVRSNIQLEQVREALERAGHKPEPQVRAKKPLAATPNEYLRFRAQSQVGNLEQKPELNLEQPQETATLDPAKTPNLERQALLEQRKTSILSGFKKTSSLFSEAPKHVQKARELRATYESRASQKLEERADQHMEGLRRPEFDVNTNPLAAISEHFIAKSNQNQPTRAFEREHHIVQAVRPAPSNLIRTARATGFKTAQLTSAIQRFTDPTANKAVRIGIINGLHHSPSLSLEVQRSLEESDLSLEVQRHEFMTEAREQENNSSLSERIAQELNGGVPLEENVRKQLEAHFNTDLSKVRVHTDGKAHELAKKANAIAFTTGKDIFFQSGKYDPNSSSGFELLAHETAHTIQQASGLVSPGFDSSSGLESDAKLEGQKAVGNRSNLEKQANNFNDYLLKPNLENQPIISPRASQRFRATHATARAIQRQADQDATETPIAKTAFVREEGLNLRQNPNQQSPSAGTFPVGTRVFVIAKTGEWLKVLVDGSKTGYMLASKIHGLNPEHQVMLQTDPGLRLFRVKQGESGWALVQRAYGIKGNESTKDQGIYHFLNAIRKINNPSMFKVVMQGNGVQQAAGKAKNWVGDLFGSGLDANDIQLQQGDLWIPSFQAAAKMDVGSGTMGGEVARVEKKVQQKIDDFKKACQLSEQFIPKAVLTQVGNSAKGLVTGLVDFAIKAAAIIAVSTAAGALIGAFAGGVGAAPGAALGFEIGLQIVELYGLAMLVQWLAQSLIGIGGAFGSFINQVWDANGDEAKLKLAAQTLADAIAKLVGFLLEALAAYIIAKGTQAVMKTKFADTVGKTELGKWAGERLKNQQARRNEVLDKALGKDKDPKEPEAPKDEPVSAASKRAEIIKQLQEKHGKAVIDTLLKQCGDNVVWLKRFLEKFETPYKVREFLQACGDAPRLNKLLNAVESRGLGTKGVQAVIEYFGKRTPELLKRSEVEVSAAVELMTREIADGGHSLDRHGPDITKQELIDRITTGRAPDGQISPTHTSSKFNSYSEMLKAQDYAKQKFVEHYASTVGLDLSRPPNSSMPAPNARGEVFLQSIVVDVTPVIGNKSIGSGYTVPAAQRPVPSSQYPTGTGTNVPGVGRVNPPSAVIEITQPITKVQIGLKWNGKKWVVGQFFPSP
jgi:Domain of unknown function (DUF4157)/Bacterial SH3 domain